MYIYKRFKTSKSAVTILVIALALAALGMLGLTGNTLARRKPATAEVTITGPMETWGEAQTFGLGKDSSQALVLSRGSWTDLGPVPTKYNFANTVNAGYEGDDLRGHLDSAGEFLNRWGVTIEFDMSSLTLGEPSTTNYKGGHSIDIWTVPEEAPTVTGTKERLWIPEGPSKSGEVTVTWISDEEVNGTRVRVFEFIPPFKIQVVSYPSGSEKKDNPRKWMRCDNLDGPIRVKVVTTL